MLVGGKVGHNLEWPVMAENLFKDLVAEIHRVGDEFGGDMVPGGAAQVAHQFGEAVLADVNHYQFPDVEFQDRLNVMGTYASGPADHQHRFAADAALQFRFVFPEILRQEAFFPMGDVFFDKGADVGLCDHFWINLF